MYPNPLQVLNGRLQGVAATVASLEKTVDQLCAKVGVVNGDEGSTESGSTKPPQVAAAAADPKGAPPSLGQLREPVQRLLDESAAALKAGFKEDIKKERQLLEVAMTYKCEHAVLQLVKDRFDALSRRHDVLSERLDARDDADAHAPREAAESTASTVSFAVSALTDRVAQCERDVRERRAAADAQEATLLELRALLRQVLEDRPCSREADFTASAEKHDAPAQTDNNQLEPTRTANEAPPRSSQELIPVQADEACTPPEQKVPLPEPRADEQKDSQQTNAAATDVPEVPVPTPPAAVADAHHQPKQPAPQLRERKAPEIVEVGAEPSSGPRPGPRPPKPPVRARKNATLRL